MTLLVTCVTALGIYRRGIFFFPHWLAIAALIVATGVLAARFKIPRKAWLHLRLTCLLTSLYILVGGAVNEGSCASTCCTGWLRPLIPRRLG